MKKGKSYLKLLGALILGGMIGGGASTAVFWTYDELLEAAKGADGFFRETGIMIETVVVLAFIAVVTNMPAVFGRKRRRRRMNWQMFTVRSLKNGLR